MAQSHQKLSLLKNKLQMPLIVRDLMVTGLSGADETIYGLNELLSDYKADMVLLCAAFTCKKLEGWKRLP